MLLTDEEIQERISSPMNLLNRLRSATKPQIPSLPTPSSQDIIPDLDDKLGMNDARKTAAKILSLSLKELEQRIPDIQKPEKLAQIAVEMNKVITANENKDKAATSQIIVYAPQVVQESHFETISLKEDNL